MWSGTAVIGPRCSTGLHGAAPVPVSWHSASWLAVFFNTLTLQCHIEFHIALRRFIGWRLCSKATSSIVLGMVIYTPRPTFVACFS